MRCECCNNILTDREATSRFKGSGMFTDMCTQCQNTLPDDVPVITRSDFDEYDDLDDSFDYESDYDDE